MISSASASAAAFKAASSMRSLLRARGRILAVGVVVGVVEEPSSFSLFSTLSTFSVDSSDFASVSLVTSIFSHFSILFSFLFLLDVSTGFDLISIALGDVGVDLGVDVGVDLDLVLVSVFSFSLLSF